VLCENSPSTVPASESVKTLPAGTEVTTFIVQRQQPGPFTVSYGIVDGCESSGPFRTFVAAG